LRRRLDKSLYMNIGHDVHCRLFDDLRSIVGGCVRSDVGLRTVSSPGVRLINVINSHLHPRIKRLMNSAKGVIVDGEPSKRDIRKTL